ncbi:MAG: O-methyltransferase [Desulfuromusa sp.]|jgi:predicted O-methyltransferase YrrM|nr:O-methyltransferase [Desulfuromusa sp.]
MDNSLQKLLSELETFGQSNDRNTNDRSQRMLNITRDTGEFLSVLIRATNAQRVLEIGTSNGYSTLWMGDACRAVGGSVTTVELSEQKFKMAKKNFELSNLSSIIHQCLCNAGGFLSESEDNAYDLVFLDSERSEYSSWWSDIKRVIRPGGLLVVDNAISQPDEIAPFISLIESDPDFTTSLVPVGKGEYLATRSIKSHFHESYSFGGCYGE